MKRLPEKSKQRGFTLVELLVVIAIIAVLAAAGFAGGSAAMNRARKVSAQSVATSIATGVEQFYTEYSALPEVAGTAPYSTDLNGKGVDILNILAGKDSGTPVQNARKIRFFSAKDAKGVRDGAKFNGDLFTALYDPWGQPYYIELDADYDDTLTFTPQGTPASLVTLRGRKVAAYSLGVANPGDSNASKLAKSW